MEIKEKIVEILAGISLKDEIEASDVLTADLALDSLGLVVLLVQIEDAFTIELKEEDMNPYDLITVEDVIAMIGKYVGDDHETME